MRWGLCPFLHDLSPCGASFSFLPSSRSRYLERAVSFAKRANAGVADVDLPVLVLLSNKRAPDECELDIQRATE